MRKRLTIEADSDTVSDFPILLRDIADKIDYGYTSGMEIDYEWVISSVEDDEDVSKNQ